MCFKFDVDVILPEIMSRSRSMVTLLVFAFASVGALQLGAATRASVVMQAAAPTKTITRQVTKSGSGPGGGGAPTISVAKPRMKRDMEDMPLFKVILLGDDEYEQDGVCEVLMNLFPDISNLRQVSSTGVQP